MEECDKCLTPLTFYTESNPSAGVNQCSSTYFTRLLQPHQLSIHHILFKEITGLVLSLCEKKNESVLNILDVFFFFYKY